MIAKLDRGIRASMQDTICSSLVSVSESVSLT